MALKKKKKKLSRYTNVPEKYRYEHVTHIPKGKKTFSANSKNPAQSINQSLDPPQSINRTFSINQSIDRTYLINQSINQLEESAVVVWWVLVMA